MAGCQEGRSPSMLAAHNCIWIIADIPIQKKKKKKKEKKVTRKKHNITPIYLYLQMCSVDRSYSSQATTVESVRLRVAAVEKLWKMTRKKFIVHSCYHRARFASLVVSSSWWLHWLSIGLVIQRSQVRLPAGALSSQLGQLSLPSLQGR